MDPDAPTLAGATDSLAKKSRKDAAAGGRAISGKDYSTMMKQYTSVIADEKTPEAVVTRLVTKAFGPGNEEFLAKFKGQDREKVFTTLVQPGVTERVKEVAKTNPEIWKTYSDWAGRSFMALFQYELNTVQDYHDANLNVSFDPKQSQFTLAANRQGWGEKKDQIVQLTVERLNRQLKAIQPILEADGKSAGDVVSEWMDKKGIDLSREARGNFAKRLFSGLMNSAKTLGESTAKQWTKVLCTCVLLWLLLVFHKLTVAHC